MRGFTKPLILVLINKNNMIDKNVITTAVEEWLAKGDYYLVDVEMTDDDRIVIEIDHADGVWIEDCADLSRFLQEKLGEELGEYELEVGSAGIGQPFKVIEQYRNHVGKEVEVLAADGKKLQGVMKEVSEDGSQFTVTVKEKQQVEGKKRPVLVEVDKTFDVNAVKYCKYLLNFK
jgi:ribosome maturation factor RimP